MNQSERNRVKIYSNNSWPSFGINGGTNSSSNDPTEKLPFPDIVVPEEHKPPSIDILWTTNLSMDQLAEVLRDSERKWDDPSLIDILQESED